MERNSGILRKIDRYVGTPLLFLIGLFRSKRNKPKAITTIGIFAFAAIGDSILSSSLLPALKKEFPNTTITVFCSKANAAIYSLIEGFDQLIILPITNPLKTRSLLRQYPVDIIIDTSQWFHLGALYTWLINSRWSIGFKTKNQNRHYAYDKAVDHSDQIHELENFQALLLPLNCHPLKSLAIRKNFKNSEPRKFVNLDSPYVVLHPWASGTNSGMREWPERNWVDLANRLVQNGMKVVISGSNVDQKRANNLFHQLNLGIAIEVIAGKATLNELSNILRDARACVSVNTGVAHLSAALEVPTVVLNGPTNSRRWGIQGKNIMNLDVSKEQGGAFLSLGFEYPRNADNVMAKISCESVISALVDLRVIN